MLLLSVTSFVSSAVFLLYSIDIFKKDKVAYIYDTSNMYLETVSNQFKNEVKVATDNAKKIVSNYQKNKSFKVADSQYLDADDFLSEVQLINVTTAPKVVDSIFKEGFNQTDILNQKQFVENLMYLKNEGQSIFFDQRNVYLADLVYDKEEQIVMVSRFESEALNTFFMNDKAFSSFVLTSQGKVLRQTTGLEESYIKNRFPNLLSKLDMLKMGTSEIKSEDNDEWLLASANVGFGDAYLLTLTNKKNAFSVLTYLVNKSLIVFFMVLSGVILISQVASSYITKRISVLYEAAKQIIDGNFKVNIEVKGNDEISVLSTTFNRMAVEIVKLLDDTANQARLESELKTAQAVQQTLFPESYAQLNTADICGSYQSASECGGDWWHYFENDDSFWFWMADATGHGAPAALLTSAIKSAVSITEGLNLDPVVAIEKINKSICQVSKSKMMMTCFLGVINKKTRELKYINASHEAPLVLKNKADLKKKDIIFLDESKCTRLGQSLDSVYQSATYQLEAGDRIVVYTDGVPDIKSPSGESLQERGFFKIILENQNKQVGVETFILSMNDQFEAFRQKTELIDDVTFFAVDVK